jgi:hypothetical protein
LLHTDSTKTKLARTFVNKTELLSEQQNIFIIAIIMEMEEYPVKIDQSNA